MAIMKHGGSIGEGSPQIGLFEFEIYYFLSLKILPMSICDKVCSRYSSIVFTFPQKLSNLENFCRKNEITSCEKANSIQS